eukprot:scaffold4013_cov140-Isochrysis_galbana.AAC.8
MPISSCRKGVERPHRSRRALLARSEPRRPTRRWSSEPRDRRPRLRPYRTRLPRTTSTVESHTRHEKKASCTTGSPSRPRLARPMRQAPESQAAPRGPGRREAKRWRLGRGNQCPLQLRQLPPAESADRHPQADPATLAAGPLQSAFARCPGPCAVDRAAGHQVGPRKQR